MTRIRRITAGLCTIVCLLSVAGCADGQTQTDKAPVSEYPSDVEHRFSHKTVHLPDGRQVDCVVFEAHYKGGISCDWDHATIR